MNVHAYRLRATFVGYILKLSHIDIFITITFQAKFVGVFMLSLHTSLTCLASTVHYLTLKTEIKDNA